MCKGLHPLFLPEGKLTELYRHAQAHIPQTQLKEPSRDLEAQSTPSLSPSVGNQGLGGVTSFYAEGLFPQWEERGRSPCNSPGP